MSQSYRAVQWNPEKRRYDAVLGLAVLLAIAAFAATGALLFPNLTAETLVIRAVGTTSFLLLHVILAIGPLCRLDPRFLPLLYNRRHLGVCMAGLALFHGAFATFQFHALGDLHPLVSLLVSDPETTGDLSQLSFQPFGLAALLILLVMAASSHDFWLANLTAPVWKAIHMSVYAAYLLLVAHVVFGALQSETNPLLASILGCGMAILAVLHVAAARREAPHDRERSRDPRGELAPDPRGEPGGAFVFACEVDEIGEKRARIVSVGGERVAIFRHDGRLSAISNVCQHQNGPLGEGRIIDGCVTCPWHGYQYDPASGRAPAPFEERIATFDLRLEGRRVFVRSSPNAAGTRVEPVRIPDPVASGVTASPTEAAVGTGASEAGKASEVSEASISPSRFLALRVAALVVGAPIVLALIAAVQGDAVPSLFEFGRTREFVGWISERPVPTLSMLRPGNTEHCGTTSILPLVARGKFGAGPATAGFDGRQVRLRGTLVHVDGNALIELADDPIESLATPTLRPEPRIESLGRQRLTGEIVDSKCHYGVMNPGRGKVHRACAARCISGGIPPSFLVRGPGDERAVLLLVDSSGRGMKREVLAWVGRPVVVEGEVMRHGDLLVFAIEPRSIGPAGG